MNSYLKKVDPTDGSLSPDTANAVTVSVPSSIVNPVDISPDKTDLMGAKQLTKPSDLEAVFRELQGSDLDNLVARKLQEENYEAHRIINPLVEEAYVSLQIDELMYVYEGDEINVEYKIGKLWTFFASRLISVPYI